MMWFCGFVLGQILELPGSTQHLNSEENMGFQLFYHAEEIHYFPLNTTGQVYHVIKLVYAIMITQMVKSFCVFSVVLDTY